MAGTKDMTLDRKQLLSFKLSLCRHCASVYYINSPLSLLRPRFPSALMTVVRAAPTSIAADLPGDRHFMPECDVPHRRTTVSTDTRGNFSS